MATTNTRLVQAFRTQIQNTLGPDAHQVSGSISEVRDAIVCLDVKFDTPSGIINVAAQRDLTPIFFDRNGRRLTTPLAKPVMTGATKDFLSGANKEGRRGEAAVHTFWKIGGSPWGLYSGMAAATLAVCTVIIATTFLPLSAGAIIGALAGAAAFGALMGYRSIIGARARAYYDSVSKAVASDIYAATNQMVFLSGPLISTEDAMGGPTTSGTVMLDEMVDQLNDKEFNPSKPPKITHKDVFYSMTSRYNADDGVYAYFEVLFQQLPGTLYATSSGYRFTFDVMHHEPTRQRHAEMRQREFEDRRPRTAPKRKVLAGDA